MFEIYLNHTKGGHLFAGKTAAKIITKRFREAVLKNGHMCNAFTLQALLLPAVCKDMTCT